MRALPPYKSCNQNDIIKITEQLQDPKVCINRENSEV